MLEKYIEDENKKIVETIIQEELNHILRITRYQQGAWWQEDRKPGSQEDKKVK